MNSYKDQADAFYNSAAWIKCRVGYMTSKNYICERCGDVAIICHHKKYITAANISDPKITLNWDNLEALCQTCHNQEHHETPATRSGVTFDDQGNLIETPHDRK